MKVIQPVEELRPYIRYYWIHESNKAFSTMTFPIGCPQLIFHRKSPLYIPELNTLQSKFTVSGQVNFPTHIMSDSDVDMIVTVFYPHSIGMFINTSPSTFYNCEISGYDLDNRDLSELADMIFDCDGKIGCIEILEKWFISRLHPTPNTNRIQCSLINMMTSPGLHVKELADFACLGKRQFERVFRETVGMNPKEYTRIVRFQKALWMMQNNENNDAAIAAECGYSDQSHFIRDFKSFSSYTPWSFRKYCVPYSDLFTNPV